MKALSSSALQFPDASLHRSPTRAYLLLALSRSRQSQLASFSRATKGAAGVEFAIILPLFLLILFAVAFFGIYIGLSHSLQAMSADASRYAMVGLDADERRALVDAAIANSSQQYALINRDLLTYEVEEDGHWLTVNVAYDVSGFGLPAIVTEPLGRIDSLQRSATVLLP
ncbi:TadE/TadG family type IV pilus assembly protein [Fulvimarina sp. MAC8]|uniref:TadE/TadG family type IV pilus assembly protein n=1 Tax=Fulvimarina sp. MAC8 TaxID=3162874 RepID=UPI0032EF3D05